MTLSVPSYVKGSWLGFSGRKLRYLRRGITLRVAATNINPDPTNSD